MFNIIILLGFLILHHHLPDCPFPAVLQCCFCHQVKVCMCTGLFMGQLFSSTGLTNLMPVALCFSSWSFIANLDIQQSPLFSPTSFFCLKSVLAGICSLYFHINLRVSLSSYIKKLVGGFDGITLNLTFWGVLQYCDFESKITIYLSIYWVFCNTT